MHASVDPGRGAFEPVSLPPSSVAHGKIGWLVDSADLDGGSPFFEQSCVTTLVGYESELDRVAREAQRFEGT